MAHIIIDNIIGTWIWILPIWIAGSGVIIILLLVTVCNTPG